MNARSHYKLIDMAYVIGRRRDERGIKVKTGTNKGKVYPYSSKRQNARQRRPAKALVALYAAWDREDCVNAI